MNDMRYVSLAPPGNADERHFGGTSHRRLQHEHLFTDIAI